MPGQGVLTAGRAMVEVHGRRVLEGRPWTWWTSGVQEMPRQLGRSGHTGFQEAEEEAARRGNGGVPEGKYILNLCSWSCTRSSQGL